MTVIDRLGDGFAVLETDSGMVKIPAEQLPQGAREGDILVRRGDRWITDKRKTAARRAAVSEKLRALTRDKND